MTVQELMEILENLDPYTEVRLAMQPAWAFEYSIENAVPACDEDGEVCLYLSEGRQIGYLPERAARALDW